MKKFVLALTVLSVLAFTSMVGAFGLGGLYVSMPSWTEGAGAMAPADLEAGEYRLYGQWQNEKYSDEYSYRDEPEEDTLYGFLFGGDFKFDNDILVHADMEYCPEQDNDGDIYKANGVSLQVAKGIGNDSYVYVGGSRDSYSRGSSVSDALAASDETEFDYTNTSTSFYIGIEYFGNFK